MKKLIKLTAILLLTAVAFSSCNNEEESPATYTFVQNSVSSIIDRVEIELIEFKDNTRIATHEFNSRNGTMETFTARGGSNAVKVRFVLVTVGGSRHVPRWMPQVFRLNQGENINIHFTGQPGIEHEPF